MVEKVLRDGMRQHAAVPTACPPLVPSSGPGEEGLLHGLASAPYGKSQFCRKDNCDPWSVAMSKKFQAVPISVGVGNGNANFTEGLFSPE